MGTNVFSFNIPPASPIPIRLGSIKVSLVRLSIGQWSLSAHEAVKLNPGLLALMNSATYSSAHWLVCFLHFLLLHF